MFGIRGIELLVIVVVALIVFGPKELPKAMRSAGAMMRTINRVSGEFRSQFDQALREPERELEIDETRNSMEAAIKNTPTPSRSRNRRSKLRLAHQHLEAMTRGKATSRTLT
jgi:sec-independent protein translocase protein TatB